MAVPKYDELLNPVLRAMGCLGGSATIAELDDNVTRELQLSSEDVAEPYNQRQTKLKYRLSWARTYLKKTGYLVNSERGVWVLTEAGRNASTVNPTDVKNLVNKQRRQVHKRNPTLDADILDIEAIEPIQITHEEAEATLEESWRNQLLTLLLKLQPAAFERLCQRVLRESGFVEVRVTGMTGDGGIDGVGVVRLGGLLGFPVLFQCKRYKDTVGAGAVRDFRGAMVGRADRGLIITTSTFTRDARVEATRDGAPPIDLVDGEQLLDKLKELRLGVSIRILEDVAVVPEFFEQI